MSVEICLLIFIGGIVGGIISSIAGGASIVSYPILLLSGVRPLFANMTNDGSLIFDYSGAIISSLKELRGHWFQTIFFAAWSTVGAILGSCLLLTFPAKVFERIIPFLLIISGLLFLIGKKKSHKIRKVIKVPRFLTIMIMTLIGCYTGYFGGASGVIVLAALQHLTNETFLVDNAIKNVICGCGNFVAFIVFIFRAQICWHQGIILALGMLIGGYLGPRFLRHVPVNKVKIIVALLAFTQAVYFFISAY